MSTDWLANFKDEFPGWAWALSGGGDLYSVIENWWQAEDTDLYDYAERYTSLLQGIKGSEWFRETTESVRDSILFEAEDPATYGYNVGVNIGDAKDLARGLGFGFDDDYYEEIGHTAERFNWTADQITHRLINDAYSSGAEIGQGLIQTTVDELSAYAANQLVEVDGSTLLDFAYRIQQGEDTLVDAENFINAASQAQWTFFDVGNAYSNGLTVSDSLASVKTQIASTLEINEDDVDLSAMGGSLVAGDEGARRFISKTEADGWARKQDAYQGTNQFKDSVHRLGGALARTFGRR